MVEAFALQGNTAVIPGGKTGVHRLPPGSALPGVTQEQYAANDVFAVDGIWYYCELTGHDADTVHWTWADLNDMQTDLAGFRGVVSENPFSIADPQVLDWSYIVSESRWVSAAIRPRGFTRQRQRNLSQATGPSAPPNAAGLSLP